MPKWINRNYVLIRIDRAKQAAKREKDGFLIIPPTMIHMRRNQQVGEVLAIGDYVKESLPMLQPGDDLLVHHSVEGSVLPQNDKRRISEHDGDIIHRDDKWNYYLVRQDKIYGLRKSDGQIFAHPNIVLAIAAPEEQDSRTLVREGHLYLFDNFKEERANVEARLKQMQEESLTHKDRAPKIMAEMEALTASLNAKRAATFMPVFVPERLDRDFGVAIDTTFCLYYMLLGRNDNTPQVTHIDIDEITFYVLRYDYVLAAKKLRQFAEQEKDTITLDEVVRDWDKKQEEERKKIVAPEGQVNLLIENKTWIHKL